MVANGRHNWVQADLRCLLCGRIEGRVYGEAPQHRRTGVSLRPNQFSAFRPAASSGPPIPLSGAERFRCSICGGHIMLDELEFFSTYDPVNLEDEPERPRRGRPPKPWRQPRDQRLEELGLAG